MPEIKHQFTGGKMNKDLDKRLVPNGEYRDAMNIQVATSEGSDVGTIQNILGNERLTQISNSMSVNPNATCVGTVSDEKNDSLYWFVREPYCGFVDNSYPVLLLGWTSGGSSGGGGGGGGGARSAGGQINYMIVNPAMMEKHQPQVGYLIAGPGIHYNTVITDINIIDANTTTIFTTDTFPPELHGMSLIEVEFDSSFPSGTTWSISGLSPASDSYLTPPEYQAGGGAAAEYYTYYRTTAVSFPITMLSGLEANQNTRFNEEGRVCKDLIIKHDVSYEDTYVVFRDLKEVTASMDVGLYQPNIPTGKIYLTSIDAWEAINIGDTILYVFDGLANYPVNLQVISKENSDPSHPSITMGSLVGTIFSGLEWTDKWILFIDRAVLKFPSIDPLDKSKPGKIITGINIIDKTLLWTDGQNEPRKINIERSITGTSQSQETQTKIVNTVTDPNILLNNGIVEEEHITVIKKRPSKAPKIKAATSLRSGLISSTMMRWLDVTQLTTRKPFAGLSGIPYAIGSQGWMSIDDVDGEAVDYKNDDILRFHHEDDKLPNEYEVRVRIIGIGHGPNPQATALQSNVSFEVQSISDDGILSAPVEENYFVTLEETGKRLFEQKLPRFSSRYKYKDNEYSAPGPFTSVVFIPGDFDYHPTEAYNLGMVNSLRELTLQDFILNDMPKDVVQVDLLYKNETSPNLYVIESITKLDPADAGSKNSWESEGSKPGLYGSYKVSTENIYYTLPSSQLLRAWDNVPRTAEAQEITGNRIIYGNYLQNYNLKDINNNMVTPPSLTASLTKRIIGSDDNLGKKSIKSLRNYDIGIVWGDKYGRETPVVTPSSASIVVPKTEAINSNALSVDMISAHPYWADYYKIFIKETSNEYYNLAMDRVYDAGDGNIWISFPSIDRNKVDEDTYLILKKGTDTDEAIQEEARYKIVAIENEAPDYIKTSYEILVQSNYDGSSPLHSGNLWGFFANSKLAISDGSFTIPSGGIIAPEPGNKSFTISVDAWTSPISASINGVAAGSMNLPGLEDLIKSTKTNMQEVWVEFSRNDDVQDFNGVSKKYKVISCVEDGDEFNIKLDEPIFQRDAFITEVGTSSEQYYNDAVKVHFFVRKIENKPEFDGRFFVKILNDTLANQKLKTRVETESNWMTNTATSFYSIEDPNLTASVGDKYSSGGSSVVAGSTNHPRSVGDWKNALKFGGSTTKSAWFVDKAPFAWVQSNNTNSHKTTLIGTGQGGSNNGSLAGSRYIMDNNGNTGGAGAGDYEMFDQKSYINQTWYGEWPILWWYVSATLNSGSTGYGYTVYENNGTGESFARLGMQGAHPTGGNILSPNFLDLSYSRLMPDKQHFNSNNRGQGKQGYWYKLNWMVGNDPDAQAATNSTNDEEEEIVSSLVPGSMFKIKGDGQVYEIVGVTKFRLFNHMGAVTMKASHARSSAGVVGAWGFNSNQIKAQINRMNKGNNRRFTYRIQYKVIDIEDTTSILLENNSAFTDVTPNTDDTGELQFVSQFTSSVPNKISTNPAIFETEPKEDLDLDIYYEATSKIPTRLTLKDRELFIPIGSTLQVEPTFTNIPDGIFVSNWIDLDFIQISTLLDNFSYIELKNEDSIKFIKDDGSSTSVKVIGNKTDDLGMIYALQIEILSKVGLEWFNCWSFSNGVESNRMGDTFNKPFLANGVKVSSIITGNYEEELKTNGLIYSGIYNPNSNTNELNQFVAAEKITKDISPIYGSIQKLHSQSSADGDLIALCEDRILKILANKDALYNADGDMQLISTNNVLGKAIPFSGEYGISKDPESFASEAYRSYFTDKVRGTVLRLSRDGITPISMYGMKDWFKDNLKLANKVIGSYDDKKGEYNVTLTSSNSYFNNTTVSFSEKSKGWVSFKSFIPDSGISCANEYYTFLTGDLYKHHVTTEKRNMFYGVENDSTFTVLLNDISGSVKSFKTLNYEGSHARINTTYDDSTGLLIRDGEYYNLTPEHGWYVESIETDLEKGSLNEFIDKEGKWFGYLKGNNVITSDVNEIIDSGDGTSSWDQSSFAIQGVGRYTQLVLNDVFGCDDIGSINYDDAVTVNDGSCIPCVNGCMDPSASNYNANNNTNGGCPDGLAPAEVCVYGGCTDPYAFNYDPNATTDDGSCVDVVLGCTDINSMNYNALANTDDSSCIDYVFGCTDSIATNYNSLANTDDGSCDYGASGCMDPYACNYDVSATIDDGSCNYCSLDEDYIDNYDPSADPGCGTTYSSNMRAASPIEGGCLYCNNSTSDFTHISSGNIISGLPFYVSTVGNNYITVAWEVPYSHPPGQGGIAQVVTYDLRIKEDGSSTYLANAIAQQSGTEGTYDSYMFGSLSPCTDYVIEMRAVCSNSFSNWESVERTTNGACGSDGCTDPYACNYDSTATNDDGSCDFSCYGCTDPTASNYDANATIDDGSCIFSGCDAAIGDSIEGGILFYLDTDCNGLIAATEDQQMDPGMYPPGTSSYHVPWGCPTIPIATLDSSIYGGYDNTVDILTQCSQDPIAALIAKNSGQGKGGSYTDWYLPSKGELNLMYIERNLIGGFDESCIINLNFQECFYWTSTSFNDGLAGAQSFTCGNSGCGTQYSQGKSNHYRVRAIRKYVE